MEPFRMIHALRDGGKLCQNDVYRVAVTHGGLTPLGTVWHLAIRRLDRAPVHSWPDLQRIKTELIGSEAEAVELYPAESRLVDSANIYHLWAFTDYRFPFGYGSAEVGS